jgi:excisionase family DNA binding protein
MVITELLKLRGMKARDLYTTTDAARLLGVHRVSVCRMIRKEDIRALRRGRAIIGILHADLSAFLEAKNGGRK